MASSCHGTLCLAQPYHKLCWTFSSNTPLKMKSCAHVASVELGGKVTRGMMVVDQRVGTLQVSPFWFCYFATFGFVIVFLCTRGSEHFGWVGFVTGHDGFPSGCQNALGQSVDSHCHWKVKISMPRLNICYSGFRIRIILSEEKCDNNWEAWHRGKSKILKKWFISPFSVSVQ